MSMSKWKFWERCYILDEKIYGYNPYWWGATTIENHLGPNNKMIFITQCRIAKNKSRKLKWLKKKGI